METKTVRLGGMALQNGVLVHAPTSWGCAVRDDAGTLHVASGRKPHLAPAVQLRMPILRGPVRLAGAVAPPPRARPAVLGSIVASTVIVRTLRRSRLLSPGSRELTAGALTLLPAALALRGPGLAAYHGAEHVSIGTYETGAPAPKEHPRCGSQLIAPLLVSSLAANVAAARGPAATRGGARPLGAPPPAPGPSPRAVSRLQSRRPISSRSRTRPATPASHSRDERDAGPGTARARGLRPSRREHSRRVLHGRVLQPHPLGTARRRSARA